MPFAPKKSKRKTPGEHLTRSLRDGFKSCAPSRRFHTDTVNDSPPFCSLHKHGGGCGLVALWHGTAAVPPGGGHGRVFRGSVARSRSRLARRSICPARTGRTN